MKKKLYFIGALVIILFVSFGSYWAYKTYQNQQEGLLSNKKIKQNLDTKLVKTCQKEQASLTDKYKAAAKSHKYTFENPYIKINPYKTSPLSALVIFRTSKDAKVTYKVVGKTAKTSILNTVNGGYTKLHQVAVVGLYSNYNNSVQITIKYKNGKTETKTFKMKTGSLPTYIENATITVSKKNKNKMNIGKNKLTVIDRTTKEPFAVDADGAVRWYSTNYSQHIIEQWSKGHIMVLTKKNQSSEVYNDLVKTDFLGRIYKEYTFSSDTSTTDFGKKNSAT